MEEDRGLRRDLGEGDRGLGVAWRWRSQRRRARVRGGWEPLRVRGGGGKEVGGGDLEGEEATSGWVGFARTRSGCGGLWMDGWTCGGLGLAMDGRMSAMSSIHVIDVSTNQNPAYVIVFFCFFYIFYPLISGKHSTY